MHTVNDLSKATAVNIHQLREAFAKYPIRHHELIAWDMYFSGLVAFQLHPGNKQDPDAIDIKAYGRLADRMILERRKRYPFEEE